MCASGAPSSAGGQRWTIEMVTAVEVVAVHLQLAAAGPPPAVVVPDPAAVPALACNIFL